MYTAPLHLLQPMERLKALLRANVDQIRGNIAAGSAPSSEQMDGYISQLVTAMNAMLGTSSPARIRCVRMGRAFVHVI
jgi:hypothetical protein